MHLTWQNRMLNSGTIIPNEILKMRIEWNYLNMMFSAKFYNQRYTGANFFK